jgi:hypothetical protein
LVSHAAQLYQLQVDGCFLLNSQFPVAEDVKPLAEGRDVLSRHRELGEFWLGGLFDDLATGQAAGLVLRVAGSTFHPSWERFTWVFNTP